MKKLSNKILISILLIVGLLIINNSSFAAVAINGGNPWVNINANDSFIASLQMRNGGTSTLGANKLDPHMATTSDWGAGTYLGTSMYGTLKTGSPGTEISLTSSNGPSNLSESKKFYSVTGNASGIMDYGSVASNTGVRLMQVAGISELYTGDYANLKTLKAYSDSRYVQKISKDDSVDKTRGQALAETRVLTGHSSVPNGSVPLLLRYRHAFGYGDWSNTSDRVGKGEGNGQVTFRPVIWNIDAN